MSKLDQKINEFFPGLVVRKDLASVVKGNAAVPSYVLEYLLGQYCATSDVESIKSGIETVKGILSKHYVQRAEADLIKSMTREKGRHKVIDKVRVSLNEKIDRYEATFANLRIKRVLVSPDTVKANPRLLVSGVWCIADIEYQHSDDGGTSPWILTALKPIQLARVDFDGFLEARAEFSTEEWIDLLIQTIGFNPEMIGKRSKLLQLARLIPYCERNYNVIELGPKGTGKSHIYSEFSPHGILLSGGEVTVPKLFVANTKGGQIGLVGFWDVVAFDEFAGKTKKAKKNLVDIMKNYMANRSFSRGIDTMEAEASMSFVGNTQHTVPYMLKHADLFDDLPPQYHDSAFLDRLHFYIPGWEIDIIRGEVFSSGYGFVVDFFAEILRTLRSRDYSQIYTDHFELSRSISTRDRDGVNKTFSGLMKLLFPSGEASKEDIEELLVFAMEGRKRVKDQLMRIDATYPDVQFSFVDKETQTEKKVQTLEEREYPEHYWSQQSSDTANESVAPSPEVKMTPPQHSRTEQHLTFDENQRGVSFDELFGLYLAGASRIVITDPYIRLFYQARNLMELVETVARHRPESEETDIHLITARDEIAATRQIEYLERIQDSCMGLGIRFTWDITSNEAIHARHIETNHGWKILLDRGLDIYQSFDANDAFEAANRLPEQRFCKAFEVTYLRVLQEGESTN